MDTNLDNEDTFNGYAPKIYLMKIQTGYNLLWGVEAKYLPSSVL